MCVCVCRLLKKHHRWPRSAMNSRLKDLQRGGAWKRRESEQSKTFFRSRDAPLARAEVFRGRSRANVAETYDGDRSLGRRLGERERARVGLSVSLSRLAPVLLRATDALSLSEDAMSYSLCLGVRVRRISRVHRRRLRKLCGWRRDGRRGDRHAGERAAFCASRRLCQKGLQNFSRLSKGAAREWSLRPRARASRAGPRSAAAAGERPSWPGNTACVSLSWEKGGLSLETVLIHAS